MTPVKTWYCESTVNNLHAFCLLRSPYRKNVEKKIKDLATGHGFLSWSLMEIDDKLEQEFIENNIGYDELYVANKNDIKKEKLN